MMYLFGKGRYHDFFVFCIHKETGPSPRSPRRKLVLMEQMPAIFVIRNVELCIFMFEFIHARAGGQAARAANIIHFNMRLSQLRNSIASYSNVWYYNMRYPNVRYCKISYSARLHQCELLNVRYSNCKGGLCLRTHVLKSSTKIHVIFCIHSDSSYLGSSSSSLIRISLGAVRQKFHNVINGHSEKVHGGQGLWLYLAGQWGRRCLHPHQAVQWCRKLE